ncbi:histone-like nucleoid-structuring protein Lsr2 [Brevibacterium litoralis]|uniref:histone-like nucleoid-structuring protein Lsr2 n=1 Tax=Brevibacterium litoralis TaxID=3138935 RepID=UPI0032EC536C
MAVKTVQILTDDMDGSEATETVEFSLDGKAYAMELSDDNAAGLRNVLAPYIEKARRVTAAPKPVARRGGTRQATKVEVGADAKTVRAWARSNGYEVPDRGRIPLQVQRAFAEANPS